MKLMIKPHETALPLIIKPWHHVTVRWNKAEKHYVCTFEGAGYKKFLFTTSRTNTVAFHNKLKELGFTQYKVRHDYSREFKHVSLTKTSSTDTGINWLSRYRERHALVRM